jgi:cell division protein DivIC
MPILSQLPSWLKNKYFLAIVFFVSWMLFFDHNDLFLQRNRANELAELKETKAYYQAQIDKTRKEVEEIRINTASLEKIAREKYMMKKDNEELFIVPASNSK